MRRKRNTNVFSLSFLDCMSCGFGAVILFFMIINATVAQTADKETVQELSEVNRIEREVLEGRKNLVQLRNALRDTESQVVRADADSAELIRRIQALTERLAQFDDSTVARIESAEKLRADIKQLEEARRRLAGATEVTGPAGEDVRQFLGEGQRQYITGLKLGGQRTLILVDASASMLAGDIVNVLRRRNLPVERQLRSAKWRQLVKSVDWLTSQLDPGGQFQIYRFAEKSEPVLAGSDGVWLDVGDGSQLTQAVTNLAARPPSGGTSLLAAIRSVAKFNPRPDNVFLLVDGLPTIGDEASARQSVSPDMRRRLFGQAIRELPSDIPINVLMYPMEGDYLAPSDYWRLAYRTGGSFMAVSDDWP